MPPRPSFRRRWTTAARWPLGVGLASWRYLWRVGAVHRWEMPGSLPQDGEPALPEGVSAEEIQTPDDGVGPLIHRIYRTRIVGSVMTPESLMAGLKEDLDRVAPSEFATFQKAQGEGPLALGDEYVVRMPGPWDGPVRVIAATPTSFRLATLAGHLEAGQIEFRAGADHRSLTFEIESWARSGDRFSDALYSHLRLAKEVQLHMWVSVLAKVAELAHGRSEGGAIVTTRRVDPADQRSTSPQSRRAERRLAALAGRPINFDACRLDEYTPETGWRRDDMVESLPAEAPGPPEPGGSWELTRRLLTDYQLADPSQVRAIYDDQTPFEGRDMLLRIRLAGMHFDVGVRIGATYDRTRDVDGRPARVYGWYYDTLEGHFEQGRMHYEVWKWLDSGEVQFRLHAVSRGAGTGPWVLRTGFRLVGRVNQLQFYRRICRRARRFTEAQLEARRAWRDRPADPAGSTPERSQLAVGDVSDPTA
jgi:uncharacterized protein (UPF0548 family)